MDKDFFNDNFKEDDLILRKTSEFKYALLNFSSISSDYANDYFKFDSTQELGKKNDKPILY